MNKLKILYQTSTGQFSNNYTCVTTVQVYLYAGIFSDIEGGDPYPPDPGTRNHCYRCSLPGLTGFTASRRGETGTGHH